MLSRSLVCSPILGREREDVCILVHSETTQGVAEFLAGNPVIKAFSNDLWGKSGARTVA